MGRDLHTLTNRWTVGGKHADGTLIPKALTGDAQRRAAGSLLGIPAAQVSDKMIQDLFTRVTTRTGGLRRDAASRVQRTDAQPQVAPDRYDNRPTPQPTTPAAAPRPTPPAPGENRPSPTPPADPTVQGHLRALTRRWQANGTHADGSMIPSAITGDTQRQATAALLGIPVAQVTDPMIQDLFNRVTMPSGLLRQDAAARIPRRAVTPQAKPEAKPVPEKIPEKPAAEAKPEAKPEALAKPEEPVSEDVKTRTESLVGEGAQAGDRAEGSKKGLFADFFERLRKAISGAPEECPGGT